MHILHSPIHANTHEPHRFDFEHAIDTFFVRARAFTIDNESLMNYIKGYCYDCTYGYFFIFCCFSAQLLIVIFSSTLLLRRICSYGLLGASGCGKTTLLSCIVGRRRLNSGEIWVLGGHPGSPGSGVPGPRIGYMPQELALYGEFTLQETLIYFGWIAGMSTSEVEEKIDFFIKLLQLPSITRFVKTLSGGQQRRMSLAAALIHGKI